MPAIKITFFFDSLRLLTRPYPPSFLSSSSAQGHVDCAYLLTSASSSLVNVADKRGLTALHWANAEQHVKLMKLLLAKGAVWSDADLLSMVRKRVL